MDWFVVPAFKRLPGENACIAMQARQRLQETVWYEMWKAGCSSQDAELGQRDGGIWLSASTLCSGSGCHRWITCCTLPRIQVWSPFQLLPFLSNAIDCTCASSPIYQACQEENLMQGDWSLTDTNGRHNLSSTYSCKSDKANAAGLPLSSQVQQLSSDKEDHADAQPWSLSYQGSSHWKVCHQFDWVIEYSIGWQCSRAYTPDYAGNVCSWEWVEQVHGPFALLAMSVHHALNGTVPFKFK